MKLFVWDFHGVLEKGNDDAVLEITNLSLKQYNHNRQMTKEESFLLSGLRWYEYFSFLLPSISQEDCFKLQTTCLEISNQSDIVRKYVQLNDHVDFVLATIKKAGHEQILISNTLPKALDMFVEIVGIEKYFPHTHRFAADSHTRKDITKKICLNEFLKNRNDFEAIISIGDSPGDMALIDEISNAKGYLYSHPHKPHRLNKYQHKINDLRCVLQEVK